MTPFIPNKNITKHLHVNSWISQTNSITPNFFLFAGCIFVAGDWINLCTHVSKTINCQLFFRNPQTQSFVTKNLNFSLTELTTESLMFRITFSKKFNFQQTTCSQRQHCFNQIVFLHNLQTMTIFSPFFPPFNNCIHNRNKSATTCTIHDNSDVTTSLTETFSRSLKSDFSLTTNFFHVNCLQHYAQRTSSVFFGLRADAFYRLWERQTVLRADARRPDNVWQIVPWCKRRSIL